MGCLNLALWVVLVLGVARGNPGGPFVCKLGVAPWRAAVLALVMGRVDPPCVAACEYETLVVVLPLKSAFDFGEVDIFSWLSFLPCGFWSFWSDERF